jgi:putative Mg2+ transporter-C (MgtC) family protein
MPVWPAWCANILLEAAQRINQLPAHEGEKCYVLKITCDDEHEDAVRQSVVNMAKELTLSLKAIYCDTAQAEGKTEIRAEVMTRRNTGNYE